MGKKLALDDDCIVLDVKTGSGAFMKKQEDARALARLMVEIGKNDRRKMLALVTDMDQPLGKAVGNSLEVIEAIETLKGKGPSDFFELCVELAAEMLVLAQKGDKKYCRDLVLKLLSSGAALNKLRAMVKGQGGNVEWIDDVAKFPKAKYSLEVLSETSGYVEKVNAEEYGKACLEAGAGRKTKTDKIDYTAGVIINKKRGDFIEKGEVIATLYSSTVEDLSLCADIIKRATVISETQPKPLPLILDKIY